ncbi:MAG: CoB--CoM heterodisulfide reductase iron-sulfur subunit A family protein, partial [Proteobacteria bacterium]|nr:CoB--CoM heterodisulfide reductase iron-sulfur subunit A family protein [Pseudomonadota bacterium]
EENVRFVRGKAARVTDVTVSPEEEGKLIVEVEDTLSNQFMRLPVDMVVLASAMEAQADAGEVARILNIGVDKDNFFREKHPKLEPLATTTDGVFLAGACQGPKDIPDTVAQAIGAAAEALTIVGKEQLELEAATVYINPYACCGCQNCVRVCAYSAPSFDIEKNVSEINEALCKGCGLCAASCPTGAIIARHFTNDQFIGEMEGLMEY